LKSKPYPSHEKHKTDEYLELDLPVSPAVMVGEEIVVEGSDVSGEKLEVVICQHLGLPLPEPQKKSPWSFFRQVNLNGFVTNLFPKIIKTFKEKWRNWEASYARA
jgi:hypothetical protein